MGRVQDAVAAALAAEITSRTEWDEPPGLYFIRYSGGECSRRRFPLPDSAWRKAPPALVLATFADALASPLAAGFAKAAPADLYGAALCTEAWIATAVAGTPEGDDLKARAKAAGGRVSKLADRIEARTMCAVDRTGTGYQVLQPRGGQVQTAVWQPGNDGREFLTGAVPRALDRIVTALLAVDLPERPRASW
jgi:hypothetical protein